MESLDPNSHSFIVKVWVEETVSENSHSIWRGHITHVGSGERSYLKDLEEISDFITPHLKEMGVHLGKQWRVRHWIESLIGKA